VTRFWKLLGLGTCAALLATGLLTGCGDDSDDDDGGGGGNSALVGIWQATALQGSDTLLQETTQILSNGTAHSIYADFVDEDCVAYDGVWTSSEDSIYTIFTVGAMTDSSVVAYTLSGNTLTITDEGGEVSTYHKRTSMASCDDYNWGGGVGDWSGTLTLSADGAAMNLSLGVTVENSGSVLALAGSDGVHAIGIGLQGTAAGTYNYPMAYATWTPDISQGASTFVATAMTVHLTTSTATHVAGTFTFTGLNAVTMGTVSITNGVFDLQQN
jgi:hypothetical protein